MRTFIGIQLSDCTTQINNLINGLKQQDPFANYTREANIHITLEFLGEISDKDIAKIERIFSKLEYSKFNVMISKLSKLRDMIILNVKETKSLMNLQSLLNKELKKEGFVLQERKYFPHITLARKSKIVIEKEFNMKSEIKEVVLFLSSRIDNVLTYTPIITKQFL